jgi:hypothetical protein
MSAQITTLPTRRVTLDAAYHMPVQFLARLGQIELLCLRAEARRNTEHPGAETVKRFVDAQLRGARRARAD